jgi:hypothetical protein
LAIPQDEKPGNDVFGKLHPVSVSGFRKFVTTYYPPVWNGWRRHCPESVNISHFYVDGWILMCDKVTHANGIFESERAGGFENPLGKGRTEARPYSEPFFLAH